MVAYPLNDAEAALFADAADRRLDSFDLLQAALVASGIRDVSTVRRLHGDLEKRLESITVQVANIADDKERGERLLVLLHERLLRQYDKDASTIIDVLEQGRFNCVSATIFYNVLAGRVGLVAKAVIVPSHVLTLLFTMSGPVEVETTSPNGFFLNRRDQSYVDFLIAQRLSTRNSHAEAETVEEMTRKPAEIDNLTMIGLIFSNQAMDAIAQDDPILAQAFLQRARKLSGPTHSTVLRTFEVSLQAHMAFQAQEEGDFERAVEIIEGALVDVDGDLRRELLQNRSWLYAEWAESHTAAGEVNRAVEVYARSLEGFPGDPKLRINLLVLLHNEAIRRINLDDCANAMYYIERGEALRDNSFSELRGRCLEAIGYLGDAPPE